MKRLTGYRLGSDRDSHSFQAVHALVEHDLVDELRS
jgi:hypothetical protein